MALGKSTLSEIERTAEARQLLYQHNLIAAIPEIEARGDVKAADLIRSLEDRFDALGDGVYISDRVLFWLRDLKDKYT